MPAESKAQQRLMAQAYALKKGDIKPEEINAEYRDKIQKLADDMTLDQLKDYAETSHEDLPEVKERSYVKTFEEFMKECEDETPKKKKKKKVNESVSETLIEDIFFLWDETIGDDRSGIQKYYVGTGSNRHVQFDFSFAGINHIDAKAFKDALEKLLKKEKAHYKLDSDESILKLSDHPLDEMQVFEHDMKGCKDKDGNLITSGDKFSPTDVGGYTALQTNSITNRVQGQLGESIQWFDGKDVWLTKKLHESKLADEVCNTYFRIYDKDEDAIDVKKLNALIPEDLLDDSKLNYDDMFKKMKDEDLKKVKDYFTTCESITFDGSFENFLRKQRVLEAKAPEIVKESVVYEGIMSELDLLAQEAGSEGAFIASAKKMIKDRKIDMNVDASFEKWLKNIYKAYEEPIDVNEGKKPKAFKDVKAGDEGTDYFNEKGTVIATAVGKKGFDEHLKKYDESGAMAEFFRSPEDFGYEKSDIDTVECVAIKDEDGDTAVFTYGGDGFSIP